MFMNIKFAKRSAHYTILVDYSACLPSASARPCRRVLVRNFSLEGAEMFNIGVIYRKLVYKICFRLMWYG